MPPGPVLRKSIHVPRLEELSIIVLIIPDVATCNGAEGLLVPMPTLPLVTVWLPLRALPPDRNATLDERRASAIVPVDSSVALRFVNPELCAPPPVYGRSCPDHQGSLH